MLTRNTGNAVGIFANQSALVLAGSPNNRRVELLTGQRYWTSESNSGSGVLLSSGNYANPILDGGGGGGDVSSVFGRTGNVIAEPTDYANFYAKTGGDETVAFLVDTPTIDNHSTTKFYVDQAIALISGGASLRGTWDADNNTPDIDAEIKLNAWYWIVSVEGSTVITKHPDAPAFQIPWIISDQAIYVDNVNGAGFYQLRPQTGDYLLLTGGTMFGDIVSSTALSMNDNLALAQSAIQAGDNVSELTNDAQYINETEIPVATETQFGGFKYTFVGGVLNLITV